ncbi:hypothetical protein BC826DRAFT_1094745 [Russula brevipes]|nr:hypothetical protein BC826DRAFT_1094745 [Russula brevipes]
MCFAQRSLIRGLSVVVIVAILKCFAHRNPSVQLYSLTLAELLSKNCHKPLHSEIASRAFTQVLERLITDCMHNYKFEHTDEPPPNEDDDARRQEEEELQRVLELPIQDKGGRRNWGSGSGSQATTQTETPASTAPKPPSLLIHPLPLRPPTGGYTPYAETRTPAVTTTTAPAPAPAAVEASSPQSTASSTSPTPLLQKSSLSPRGALHTFHPTEPNRLVGGQIRGCTGIFPVNYVEHLLEPTQEATVFSQAANIDRLLVDNLADNEEIQEHYHSCMTLRLKIVKLIDKYTDLVSMNESFIRACTIFDVPLLAMQPKRATCTPTCSDNPCNTGSSHGP